jgi:excisionase family DNA binding protein
MTYYTKQEVADILRVLDATIEGYIRKGLLPATRPAGKVLVHKKDLDAFIEAGRIPVGGRR